MNNAEWTMSGTQPATRPLARVAFRLVGPFIIYFTIFITHLSYAQPGTWQTHFSYRFGQSVALVGDKVYCGTRSGFFYYDKATGEAVSLSKIQGFSDVGVSRLLYLADQKRLLIAYQNGNLDFLVVSNTGEPGVVKNVSTILTAPNITGSRAINYVDRIGNYAYLSTDFGLVVLDVVRDEIRDTYFSPKLPNGVGAGLLATAVSTDTLFALSASANVPSTGLLLQAVRLAPNVNIADPANWRLVPKPGGDLQSIRSIQGRLTASVGGQGVYERQNGRWVLTRPVSGQRISLFSTLDSYGLANDQTITLPSSVTFTGPLLTADPLEIVTDGNQVWVADRQNGLLAGRSGGFERIAPEGPVRDPALRLYAYPQTLVTFPQTAPDGPHAEFYAVPDGRWQGFNIPNYRDVGFTTAAYLPAEKRLYLGLPSASGIYPNLSGLWHKDEGQPPTPVTLPGIFGPNFRISSLAADLNGNLWIATPDDNGGQAALYVRRPDGTFQAFPATKDLIIRKVVPDDTGFLWLIADGKGLVVFDPETNRSRQFAIAVQALLKDRNGVIWIGTGQGLRVFDNPVDAFDLRIAVESLNENRPRLLRNETINAIAVDGGNQKWVGTSSGLYHVSADGSQLLSAFAAGNSPLPNDNVRSLAIEPISGRVFILSGLPGSANKLVSYGGTATEPAETLSKLTIFPNPVRPDFAGTVGINGLTDNSTVKILDAGGQLVYETRSQGGTATWNLQDYRGRSAQTGVYLVVVVTADGTEGLAGKLAVVR